MHATDLATNAVAPMARLGGDVILRLGNVESSYGPVQAIRGVSLEVRKGSIVAVLGANGAGKTTILKTISGIIDPQKGTVWFDGEEIQRRNPDWVVRRGISHVPEGREVFPLLTVRENLLMGAFTRDDKSGIAADLERMYAYFPILRERRDQEAGQLSGGQQQMLAIARALMLRPRLLVLDEPSFGLAPLVVQDIFRIMRTVNREEKVSILLVEQNARLALELADAAYLLETGSVVMGGAAAELRDDETVRRAYLGY